MIVRTVSLRNFRSYARLELELDAGLVLVVGPNGAGKTNLLESLHLGTQGFSPRTRSDAQMIRFGETAGRVALAGERNGAPVTTEVVLQAGAGKRAQLNGAPLRTAEHLRSEIAALVFTPDRLAVVKGGPAVRRAYFDRALGRASPARALLPMEYGAAVGQRNAALRRIAAGFSTRAALAPWTERVASLGAELGAVRHELVSKLSPGFAEQAAVFGLGEARLLYEGARPTTALLEARYDRDLERGTTGLGPHLDDVAVLAADRDLRTYGSQGEQRIAVLALIFAEAALLESLGGGTPLLLLDDVLSELDPERRRALAERLTGRGQALVTSTSAATLPGRADQLLEVSPGRVEARA